MSKKQKMRSSTFIVGMFLFGLLVINSTPLYASKLAWHLPDQFLITFLAKNTDRKKFADDLLVPVTLKVRLSDAGLGRYPHAGGRSGGALAGMVIEVGGETFDVPYSCLKGISWPVEAAAIQQSGQYTTALLRVSHVLETSKRYHLSIHVNVSPEDAVEAIRCEVTEANND